MDTAGTHIHSSQGDPAMMCTTMATAQKHLPTASHHVDGHTVPPTTTLSLSIGNLQNTGHIAQLYSRSLSSHNGQGSTSRRKQSMSRDVTRSVT